MSAKYLKKQLFLGIVTLMITVFSITGATYAWFSLNNTVTADGMQISANTEGINFEITNEYITGTSTPVFVPGQTQATVTFATSATLIPTHPVGLNNLRNVELNKIADWYHAYSAVYDDANVDELGTKWPNVYCDLTGGNGYYWNGDPRTEPTSPCFAAGVLFSVRLNPDTTGAGVTLKDIKANNIIISDGSKKNELSKCVYLAVAGPDGASVISTSAVTTGEPVLGSVPSESDILIDTMIPGTEYTILVVAYFDGRDKDCTSANFDPNSLSISLDFTGTQA